MHVYTDGTCLVSHGGVEMGQGLHTKVAQIAAQELGIPLADVFIAETATDKVANASPTAASASSDLYGSAGGGLGLLTVGLWGLGVSPSASTCTAAQVAAPGWLSWVNHIQLIRTGLVGTVSLDLVCLNLSGGFALCGALLPVHGWT